jgi:sec-independent protein translocase protein TatB
MFDIGWTELVVIGVVALIAIGPKELPGVLRTVGQWMGKVRRMAAEFQGQFQEAMREAEMADLKKQVEQISDSAKGLGSDFDPFTTGKREIERSFDDKPSSTGSTPETHGETRPDPGSGAGVPAVGPVPATGTTTDVPVPASEPAPGPAEQGRDAVGHATEPRPPVPGGPAP